MPHQPIEQFTLPVPTITDPLNFPARGDILVSELPRFVNQSNALALEMNLYATYGPGAALAPSGFKNKIIGGDFSLNPWQRGTSLSVNSANSGVFLADRFFTGLVGASVVTIARTADAPTAVQAGYFTQHCLSATVTTASGTLAASDAVNIAQRIEGFNIISAGFGQAGSRFITQQFWVKSPKTGIHALSFRNGASNRSYVAEYTVNAVNTWEFKTVTIPVDTAGTWLYDNGIGLIVSCSLAVGSSNKTAPNMWTAGNFTGSTNSVNVCDTVGNSFRICLIQTENGSTATQFESRGVGQELELCQRYYLPYTLIAFAGYTTQNEALYTNFSFLVEMRATPTWTQTSAGSANPATVVWTMSVITRKSAILDLTPGASGATSPARHFFIGGAGNFNAEL